MPYRDIIDEAGGEYVGFDRISLPANVSSQDRGPDNPLQYRWDAVICTQVIQYVPHPDLWLDDIRRALKPGCPLLLTGPTNWPIVEFEDRWRYTPTGIGSLLNNTGFYVEEVAPRAVVEHNGENWLLGWGAVARG